MSLIALAAVALVIIAVTYLMLSGRQAEREVGLAEIQSQEVRDELAKLQGVVDGLFEDAIYESVDEMGRYGGFSAENAPLLNHLGAPFWFYRGRAVSIPTAEVMSSMLEEEVERRLGKKLDGVRAQVRSDLFAIGAPTVNATLHDHAIEARASVPLGFASEAGQARTSISFSKEVPLRLKYLRDVAERYVRNYTSERMMEKALLNGLIQDQRVPTPPGMVGRNVDCDSQTVYAYRKQLIEPVRENAQLAVARELARAKELLRAEQYIEVAAELNVRDVNFTFVANANATYGGKAWESTEAVYYVPFDMPLVDRRELPRLCPSRYTISYTVQFPVRFALRDIHETSRIVRGEGVATEHPLEFQLYLQPLLVGEHTNATDSTVLEPATVDDLCRGACDVDITVKNSERGTVHVGSCAYPYTGGRLVRGGVPCKVQDLVVVSDDPVGLAKHVEKVKIERSFGTTIVLKDYAVLSGRVFRRRRVLCTNTHKVIDQGEEALGHVDGSPPRTVTVLFRPVEDSVGPLVKATVDREGRYATPQLNPGRYIVLAVPSEDSLGRPQYEVSSRVLVVDVTVSTTLDIEMTPLLAENVAGTIEHVTARTECTG